MIQLHKLKAMSIRLQKFQEVKSNSDNEMLTAVIELAELISNMQSSDNDLRAFEESIVAASEDQA